jgi:hypothetical protein
VAFQRRPFCFNEGVIPGFPQAERDAAARPTCSAKGCREAAAWQVVWNNPKLHAPERRKLWLACDDHRQSLADFLDLRGFLIGVEPFQGGDADSGGTAGGPAAGRPED